MLTTASHKIKLLITKIRTPKRFFQKNRKLKAQKTSDIEHAQQKTVIRNITKHKSKENHETHRTIFTKHSIKC